MHVKRISLLACAFALGGCVASPDGQMTPSQMTQVKPPCASGQSCPTHVPESSFGEMSKGISSAFEKLTGGTVDPQTETMDEPTK